MVSSVVGKAIGKLKFLYRYKDILDFQLRKKLCSALIQRHLEYCSTSWFSSLLSRDKCKLQIIQNKMVPYILNLTPRSHIGQAQFIASDCLRVSDRVKQLRLNHVYKIVNGSSPMYLKDNFTSISTKHRYGTRNSSTNFYVPQVNSVTKCSFFYNAILDWNVLQESIKRSSSLAMFKNNVKMFLVNSSTQRENCDFSY